jgi:hypothetical protein
MSARESNRRSVFCQPTIPPWGRGERSKNKLSVRYWEDPRDVLEWFASNREFKNAIPRRHWFAMTRPDENCAPSGKAQGRLKNHACQRNDDTGESFLNGVSRFLVDRRTGHKIAGRRTD